MSAEAALNKSLDDLIAEQRVKKDGQKKRVEGRRGGRPAADRAPKHLGGGGPREPRTRNISITVKGGVGKRRSAGNGPAPLLLREERDHQAPEARAAALDGGAKWGHDMYRGPVGGAGRRAQRGPRDPTHLGTKLFISNLHYNVTDADIKELFETCGPLVSHTVHYDNSGRSEGTAEVVYGDAPNAERALRRYNNVQLDGQAMQIELIERAAAPAGGAAGGPRTLSSGIRISGERGGGRTVQVTRAFQQAAGGTVRAVRGRGAVRARGGPTAMED